VVIYISVGTVIDKMKENMRIAAGIISFDMKEDYNDA